MNKIKIALISAALSASTMLSIYPAAKIVIDSDLAVIPAGDSSKAGTLDGPSKAPKTLHDAIIEGNEALVLDLIKKGANVNERYLQGMSPLHLAVKNNRISIVKMLLDAGANKEAIEDEHYHTPIHIAAVNGNIEILELLINSRANFNAKNRYESTILHLAAEAGHSSMIKLLIKKFGMDINATNNIEGFTALKHAVVSGHKEAVKTLIDLGATIEAENGKRITPLHLAALNGKLEIAVLLIDKGANIWAKDIYENTVLHLAAEKGHSSMIALLLKKFRVDINEVNIEGVTPLHYAAINGHKEVVKTLIDLGVNLEITQRNLTPLHYAALTGKIEIVELLINSGAIIEAKYIGGNTILHFAAFGGHATLIELLIKKLRVDINAVNSDGFTALYYAVQNLESVKILINFGANINAITINKDTPLYLAAQNKQFKVMVTLLSYGANIMNDPRKEELIPLLVENLLNMPREVILTLTPLIWSCIAGDTELALKILTTKAPTVQHSRFDKIKEFLKISTSSKTVDNPLNETMKATKLNETPLTLAIKHGNYETAKEIYKLLNPIRQAIAEGCKFGEQTVLAKNISEIIGEYLYGSYSKKPLE